jgi:hypothetical protein
MSAHRDMRRVSALELNALAVLGADSVRTVDTATTGGFRDEAEQAKWEEEQAKQEKEEEHRRQQAAMQFEMELDQRLHEAYLAGVERAVSTEARRAISVRSYVLLGVVAAVVSMPLIAMLLHLDPQTFGAFIAPVTGIAGTIVGYWFGTVGQGTSAQGVTRPQGHEQS